MTQSMGASEPLYSPLHSPNIRLVSFSGGQSGREINIDLLVVPLTEELEYCALSYVWGEQPRDKTVWINGYPVLVTQHLYNFLDLARTSYTSWKTHIIANTENTNYKGRIRQSEGIRWWIDALCIDQGNVDERNAQVPRMGKIYSSAEQVMLWLGTRDEVFGHSSDFWELRMAIHAAMLVYDGGAKLFFVELARLVRQSDIYKVQTLSRSTGELLGTFSEVDSADTSGAELDDDEDDDDDKALQSLLRHSESTVQFISAVMEQLNKVVRHPYFTRTWIIQEFVLGRNFPLALIGANVLRVRDLDKIVVAFFMNRDLFGGRLSALTMNSLENSATLVLLTLDRSSNWRIRREQEDHDSAFYAERLSIILRGYRRQLYTLVHDMYYGLIGLIDHKELPPSLLPDYSISYDQVS